MPASLLPATQLPHAAGIAWATKCRRGRSWRWPIWTRATSAEDFHAGLNFAAVFGLPAVFVCENDPPRARPRAVRSTSETLAVKALAYGMPGVRVDGSDLFAVLPPPARRWPARNGDGATLIEAVIAEGGDPLPRVRQWLASQDMLDDAAESALRHEVDTEVDVALATPR